MGRSGKSFGEITLQRKSKEGGVLYMAMVQKEDVMKRMDQMLSSLDLLEMNIGIRMNHALKDASEKICNKIEITEMHIEHMENKLVHHEEKGNWIKTFQNVVVSA